MDSRNGVRLCLTLRATAGSSMDALAASLDATPCAAIIVLPSSGGALDDRGVSRVVRMGQSHGAAVLLADDAALAKASGADGVHLTASADAPTRHRKARAAVGPDAIVGVDAGSSRHAAMIAGEAGADYVSFGLGHASPGDRDDAFDLTEWWAEIFETPCVAFATTPEEATAAAAMGADFVAFDFSLAWPDAEARRRMAAFANAAKLPQDSR